MKAQATPSADAVYFSCWQNDSSRTCKSGKECPANQNVRFGPLAFGPAFPSSRFLGTYAHWRFLRLHDAIPLPQRVRLCAPSVSSASAVTRALSFLSRCARPRALSCAASAVLPRASASVRTPVRSNSRDGLLRKAAKIFAQSIGLYQMGSALPKDQ